jgi:outer membrane usher protein
MRRLRVGDAVSAAGSWGRPVRFGGLRWGSAFDTAPGFVTAPTLALAGQTALPSEVEVYVNDALQRRQQVAPGPFTITDVPAVTGDGSLRMVVRDLLGREQVVLVPYYAGLGLLRPGLDDWSVEAGALRRDWGLDSNDYGEAFAAATWRHGFAQAFTGESHAELRPKRQAAGLGGALGTELGTVSASLAGSRSPGGGGVLGRLGWDYSGPRLGLGLTAEQASPAFSQLGLDDPRRLRARQQARASAGDPQLGSVAVSVSRLTYWREQEGATVSSLTHAVGLGWGTVISSATWTLPEHDRRDLTVGLTLVVPLAEATTATGGWSRSSTAGSRGYVQASRVPRDDEDWGVRALHEEGTVERSAVGGTLNTRMATLAVDAAQADGIQSLRLQAQGSVVAAGGGAFAGRGLGESFAVVDTGGHAGVGINRDNRRVATTDGDGRALVVGLRPYEANRIAIDPSDLPPEVETPALHQAVVPWRGAGSLVRFPLSTSRAAILRLVRPGGLPVPVGARAMVGGRPLDIPVGYDGQLLIAPGDRPGMVEVAWPGGGCRAELPPGGGAVLTTVPAECLSP